MIKLIKKNELRYTREIVMDDLDDDEIETEDKPSVDMGPVERTFRYLIHCIFWLIVIMICAKTCYNTTLW